MGFAATAARPPMNSALGQEAEEWITAEALGELPV